MEPTKIITIVIFAICGLFLLWAIKTGNNIKFKKKEKKSKSKAPKEEKFKEVIPKEKKEKPEKKKPEKIRDAVKEEKAGKSTGPTNKVMKVTKDDFKQNDMAVPEFMKDESDKKEEQTIKSPAKDFKLPDLDSEFKLPDFPADFKLPDFDSPGMNDFSFPNDLKDDFLGVNPDDLGLFDLPKAPPKSLNDNSFPKFNDLPPIDYSSDLSLPSFPSTPKEKGTIKNESIDERYEKMFGDLNFSSSSAKEIIVGDIINGNRSRTNRELRAKRIRHTK